MKTEHDPVAAVTVLRDLPNLKPAREITGPALLSALSVTIFALLGATIWILAIMAVS